MKYIHVADIHLKKSVPVCRAESEEEWFELQKKSLEFLRDLTIEENGTLLIVGDIFDIPVASVTMVTLFLDVFLPIKERVLILAGNHDLRGHNLENIEESSYGILAKNFKQIPDLDDEVLGGHHFNTSYSGTHSIVCTHQFVAKSQDECDLYGVGVTPTALAEQYPYADIVLLGDNHHGFIEKTKDKVVLNPGCMTRQKTNFADYKPLCFLIDSETKEITVKFLPDCETVLSEEHILSSKAKEERTAHVVELVRNKTTLSLDFEDNLTQAARKVDKGIQKEVEAILLEIKKVE